MYLRPTGTMVALGLPAAASLNVPIGVIVGKVRLLHLAHFCLAHASDIGSA